MSETPSTASVGVQKQSNSPDFDIKQPNTANGVINVSRCDSDDEYSDPDTIYDSEEEDEEDEFDEDPTLFIPDIDQRKISQSIYCPLIAEKIILNSQATEKDLGISTEMFQRVQENLTGSQHEIALIWIVRAYSLFKFRDDEDLYKSIYLLNMLLCRMPVVFNDLQLMSIVCIWIACKVESNLHIPISSLRMICPNLTDAQIKTAEPLIVTKLNCNLSPVTPLFYIQRFLEAIDADENLSNVAYFFIDVSLVYHDFLDYSPTVIAVSSVCGSKLCMNEFCPTPRLFGYAHVSDKEKIRQCITLLFTHANAIIHQNKSAIKDRFKGDPSLLLEINLDPSLISQL